ncbi:MAG: hypothetical protein C5B50_05990 [Verrucomicrobia bacterium]|nr:MAG: hypothetical protein C5B50_05990 [Verrucomicrobiota bacterium]
MYQLLLDSLYWCKAPENQCVSKPNAISPGDNPWRNLANKGKVAQLMPSNAAKGERSAAFMPLQRPTGKVRPN